MPRNRRQKQIRAASKTGATAISIATSVASGGLGVVSGIVHAVSLVFERYWDRQQSRGTRMLQAAFPAPDEQFAEVMRTKLETEEVRDAVLEAMRAALESMSDQVVPALGGLIRDYDREKRRPDAFFRACCRVLQDLSDQEYASFAAVIRRIASAPFDERLVVQIRVATPREEWAQDAEEAPKDRSFVVTGTAYIENPPSKRVAATGCAPEHTPRLFHLLDREGLAQKHAEGRSGDIRYCEIEATTARRIPHRWSCSRCASAGRRFSSSSNFSRRTPAILDATLRDRSSMCPT